MALLFGYNQLNPIAGTNFPASNVHTHIVAFGVRLGQVVIRSTICPILDHSSVSRQSYLQTHQTPQAVHLEVVPIIGTLCDCMRAETRRMGVVFILNVIVNYLMYNREICPSKYAPLTVRQDPNQTANMLEPLIIGIFCSSSTLEPDPKGSIKAYVDLYSYMSSPHL